METYSRPQLVVLATSHRLQGEKFLLAVDDPCYRKLVKQLIVQHKTDFVFEEAAGHTPTYAEAITEEIAKNRSKTIGYLDIDPSGQKRKDLGMSGETGEAYMVDLGDTPPCHARTEFLEDHETREQLWFAKVMSTNFASALVILGSVHGLSFSFRLRNAGFRVEDCLHYLPFEKLCGHTR